MFMDERLLRSTAVVPLAGVEPASVRPPSGATALTVELQGTYSVVSYGTALAVRSVGAFSGAAAPTPQLAPTSVKGTGSALGRLRDLPPDTPKASGIQNHHSLQALAYTMPVDKAISR